MGASRRRPSWVGSISAGPDRRANFEPAAQRRTWRLVAVATVALLVVWGIAYSFGSFLQPVAQDLTSETAPLAGVFSTSAIVYFTVGWPAGAWHNRIGARRLVLGGALALVVGLVGASHIVDVLGLYVTYGLGVGLAVGLVYVPLVSEVVTTAERSKTLAVGVTVSGVGIGTLIGPPSAAAMIEAIGWRTTFAVFGLVGGMVLAGCAAALPPKAASTRPDPLPASRRDTGLNGFSWLYMAATLMALALYVPFVYLPSFAEGLGVSPVRAAATISVIGAASIVGRFGLAVVASRAGLHTTYVACYMSVLASFGIWLVADTLWHLVAFGLILGVGYGGFIALTPAIVSELVPENRVGRALGLLYTSAAIGTGIGPPLAAALLDSQGDYVMVILTCLAAMILALTTLFRFLRLSST